MQEPENLRSLLVALMLGVPVLAIAAARLGVGAALLAVSAFLSALLGAAFTTHPAEALSMTKDVIVAISAAAAVLVAWKGLQTWKHQSIANRQAEFLDELIEEAQRFALSMSGPNQVVRFVRIGLTSYTSTAKFDPRLPSYPDSELDPDLDFDLRGAASYIVKNGESDSKRLWALLEPAGSHAARIRALANKGQVLGFDQYWRCHNACQLLTWQYDRMQDFASTVGGSNLNFENLEVQRSINKTLPLDAADVESHLQDQLTELVVFARSSYEHIFA